MKLPYRFAFSFPFRLSVLATAMLTSLYAVAQSPAAPSSDAPAKTLGIVTVNSGQPTSLPKQTPTTIEGVTKEQIEQSINATDSQDALKYFPSLLVRKRYIGDYNHAVLSSRASGTGNSARSMVYADGILLSNYLGNGAAYTPRWGLVAPEEIERVDVLYGPFSAAYAGNSVGAVVDYVTRMPKQFEANAKLSTFSQNFKLYGTDSTYGGTQASASLGNKNGDWSWFANVNRTQSASQPLVFATRTLSAAAPVAGAQVVSGAAQGLNTTNTPIVILGGSTQYNTTQDHAKVKLADDFTPTVRASYALGYWKNTSENRSQSYLRNAAGTPVYSGNVSIDGRGYALAAGNFGVANESLQHVMHGLSVKSNTQGVFDWEVAASLYSYSKDQNRAAITVQPGSLAGGAGTLTDQGGTGWSNLAVKGIWRPDGNKGPHIVDFGYQQDSYKLRILRSSIAGNYLQDAPSAVANDVGGKTQLRSLYAQDTWSFAPKWKTVLGGRLENFNTNNGFTTFGVGNVNNATYTARSFIAVSPKAALSYRRASDTVLKASTGRAARFPTVADINGFAYTGASKYFTTDVRVRFQSSKQVSMALGIDNLNNYQYWNFHPYPQRTLFAEVKFAL